MPDKKKPQIGDWVVVHRLPSLTAERSGEIVKINPYALAHARYSVDLGDRVYLLGRHDIELLPPPELDEEYLA